MSEQYDQDAAAWRSLRDWLARDDQGRRILHALATDPEAGALALKERLAGTPAPTQVTNNLRDFEVGKFATFARADRVVMGDQYYYSDHSRHLEFDPLAPARSATGIARILMVGGILTFLIGVALTAYNSYVYYNNYQITSREWFNNFLTNPTPTNVAPPTLTIPGEIIATVAIAFLGVVLFVVGGIMRPRGRRTRDRIAGER